jgi:hypothetical protein
MKSKEHLIMTEIVFKHHPDFVGNIELQETMIKLVDIIRVERLVEHTMAHVGGYKFVDGNHCDFSDGSECKTASVRPTPCKKSSNSFSLEISNVISSGGCAKTGPIRVVLYNPHLYKLKYYYIPANTIHQIGVNVHPTTKTGRLFATWNSSTDTCNKLDPYEVDSFEKLAKK